jgi:hypothetical protein
MERSDEIDTGEGSLDERKNYILFTLFGGFDRFDCHDDRFRPVFLEKDPFRSDGCLSKDGRRGWDGGYQCPHLELHQF